MSVILFLSTQVRKPLFATLETKIEETWDKCHLMLLGTKQTTRSSRVSSSYCEMRLAPKFFSFLKMMVNRKALTFVKNVRIFADRMGKLFRENPIQIAFPEAVNLFSARSKFVHEASQKSTVRLWNVFLSGDSCVKTDDKICVHWDIRCQIWHGNRRWCYQLPSIFELDEGPICHGHFVAPVLVTLQLHFP